MAPVSLTANQVELNGGTLNFSSDLTGLSLSAFTSGSSSTITTLTANGVTAAALKVSNSVLSLSGGVGGSGLTGTVTLTIAPPDMPGGVQATASVIITSNTISGYIITNAGSGYSVPPAIYLTTSAGTLPGANPTVGYYGFTGSTTIESEGSWLGRSALRLTISVPRRSGRLPTSTSTTLAATRGIQLDAAGGSLDVSNSPGGFLATVPTPISGAGMLTKTGSGVLLLTNTANSWSGGTTITGGVLDFADNAFPTNFGFSPLVVGSGGILCVPYGGPSDYTASQVSNLLASGSFAAGSGIGFDTTNLSGTYGNNLSGSLALAKLGANTLTLTGSNSYTGVTYIDGGILSLGSSNALGSTSAITFNGGALQGTLQYSGSNTTDYSSIIKNSGGAISIDTNGQNITFASALASSNFGGLIKNGLGQLALSVANSFTGPVIINSGTLQVGNANSLPGASYPVTINASGMLDLNNQSFNIGPLTGSGSIENSPTGASNSILTVYPGVGLTSTFAGSFVKSGTTAMLVGNGTLVMSGTSYLQNLYAGGGGITITGSVAVAGAQAGYGNTGPININGGYLNDSGVLTIGNNGTAVVSITSGTAFAGVYVSHAGNTGNSSVLNLNAGGVLLSSWVVSQFNNSGGDFTLNFNGGTLRSTGIHGNGGQIQALLANYDNGQAELVVTTGSNGAFIDTNGATESSLRPIMNVPGQVGTVTKVGAGTLTMTNTNSYTGLTTVSAGTLIFDYSAWASSTNVNPDPILPAGNPAAIAGGATLSFKGRPNVTSGTASWKMLNNGGITEDLNGGSNTGLVVGEPVSGLGIPAGAYITQLYGGSGGGNIIISAPATTATTATLTFGGATFNAVNQVLGTLNLTSGTATLDVEANGGSGMTVTVSGSVYGPGALRVTSAGNTGGALFLSASNSYSGGTILSGGTLNYQSPYGLGTSGTVTFTGTRTCKPLSQHDFQYRKHHGRHHRHVRQPR